MENEEMDFSSLVDEEIVRLDKEIKNTEPGNDAYKQLVDYQLNLYRILLENSKLGAEFNFKELELEFKQENAKSDKEEKILDRAGKQKTEKKQFILSCATGCAGAVFTVILICLERAGNAMTTTPGRLSFQSWIRKIF